MTWLRRHLYARPAPAPWLPGVRLRDLHSHAFVMGASGSGKTVTLARLLRLILESDAGLFYPAVKPDDGLKIRRLVARSGRRDVVWIGPGGGVRVNPFAGVDPTLDEGSASVADSGNLSAIATAVQRLDGAMGASDGGVWKAQGDACARNAAALCRFAGRVPTFGLLRAVILSAATSPRQVGTPGYKAGVNYRLLAEASRRDRPGVERCLTYWSREYLSIPPRQRQGLLAQILPALDLLTTGACGDIFGGEPTHSLPDLIEAGAVLVCDFSPGKFGQLGIAVTAALKDSIQRAGLARVIGPQSKPCFSVIDEYSLVCSEFDATFLATARSARMPTILALQGRESLLEAWPGSSGEARADVCLGNCATKIFARQTPASAAWLAGLLGGRLTFTVGGSTAPAAYRTAAELAWGSPEGAQSSFSQQTLPWVEPHQLQRLRTGSDAHGRVVDLLVLPGAGGKPYRTVSLKREEV